MKSGFDKSVEGTEISNSSHTFHTQFIISDLSEFALTVPMLSFFRRCLGSAEDNFQFLRQNRTSDSLQYEGFIQISFQAGIIQAEVCRRPYISIFVH